MADKIFHPTIGLEIHAELKTQSKMFCSCANNPFIAQANKNICPVCTGQPGAMPVPNIEAIKSVIKAGMALNCSLNTHSKFDRKNYFYPDLPKGYQISQFDLPLCYDGFLNIGSKRIGIKRIHIEEDTAKLVHKGDDTLIDYNRAGVPLMELVTEPDFTTGEEAKIFGQELQLLLRYLDISDADMEKGQMRVEVNISISDSNVFGTKVEVKNINSFANAQKAIEFEIKRQEEVLREGGTIVQETRGWDAINGKTVSQRVKEGSSDYRYFPEPDIPSLDLSAFNLEEIKRSLPELPWEKRARFFNQYGLDAKLIDILVENKELSEYFEKIISELGERQHNQDKEATSEAVKLTANYLINDYLGMFWQTRKDDNLWPITPENFAEFIAKIQKGEITTKVAKFVLQQMFETNADPTHIIAEQNLSPIGSEDEITLMAQKVLESNPVPVADFKKGKQNAIMFLVGQLLKESKGKIDPNKAKEILSKLLH